MISTYDFETFWSPHPRRKCRLSDKEISMMLFEKLCSECKNIETINHIQNVSDFFIILQEMKLLVENDNCEYIGGNNPEKTIKQWSQDGLWYRIKCKKCGTIFTLYYDIFVDKGCFKKGK